MPCPPKKIIWLLTGEVPHIFLNMVIYLIHLSQYIYPDGVWCNVQSSGIFKWRYFEYSLAWCTIMSGMKHLPLSDPAYLFTFKYLVSTYDLVPPFIVIKPNFITVAYLGHSFLNSMRSDRMFVFWRKGWLFSDLSNEYLSFLFTLLACSCYDMLAVSIALLLFSLFLILKSTRYIFWNINQAILGLLFFPSCC